MSKNEFTDDKAEIHKLYREIININFDCKKILFSTLVNYDEIISSVYKDNKKELPSKKSLK